MNLYIMTRGRVGKQFTLSRLPERWKAKTWLVSDDEGHTHQQIRTPSFVTNYSKKFQWILDDFPELENSGWAIPRTDKAVILDDDLVFSKEDKDGRILTITDPEQVGELFDQMEVLLDTYPLVGVHPRQMAHTTAPPFVENGRIICMQGINRRLIGKVRVDQFPILADVVLNCTILSRGQKNALITTYFQDHGPCQAPGGCSIYRTSEMQREAVRYLADRFGPYVQAVERKVKTKWLQDENGVRHDYTAQWKKLHRAGAAHVLDPGKVPHPDREIPWKAPSVLR